MFIQIATKYFYKRVASLHSRVCEFVAYNTATTMNIKTDLEPLMVYRGYQYMSHFIFTSTITCHERVLLLTTAESYRELNSAQYTKQLVIHHAYCQFPRKVWTAHIVLSSSSILARDRKDESLATNMVI